jgi:hypothetical protein
MRAVDNDYIAQTGEVLFADYATTEQKNTAFPLYNSGIPILTKMQKITALNAEYKILFEAEALKEPLSYLADGTTIESKRLSLQTNYLTLLTEKNTKRSVILNA